MSLLTRTRCNLCEIKQKKTTVLLGQSPLKVFQPEIELFEQEEKITLPRLQKLGLILQHPNCSTLLFDFGLQSVDPCSVGPIVARWRRVVTSALGQTRSFGEFRGACNPNGKICKMLSENCRRRMEADLPGARRSGRFD